MVAAGLRRGHERGGPLPDDDLDAVLTDVSLEVGGHPRSFGMPHTRVVLDADRVVELATEALGDDSGANPLARGVDRRTRPGRAAADDEHLEGLHRVHLGCGLGVGALVDLAENVGQTHPALPEHVAVEVDRRHRLDAALGDLVLEHSALDGDVRDVLGVEHAHDVESLDDIGTVLARQGHVSLEVQRLAQPTHLLGDLVVDLGRVAPDVEQGEHERGELVAERDAGEGHLDVGARPHDPERWAPGRGVGGVAALMGDQVGQAGDLVEQVGELVRLGRVVQGADQRNRVAQVGQVAAQLVRQGRVEHRVSFSGAVRAR